MRRKSNICDLQERLLKIYTYVYCSIMFMCNQSFNLSLYCNSQMQFKSYDTSYQFTFLYTHTSVRIHITVASRACRTVNSQTKQGEASNGDKRKKNVII